MNEDELFERVRMVAEAVLHRLGHHAPPWQVVDVGWASGVAGHMPQDSAAALRSPHEVRSKRVPRDEPKTPVAVLLGSSGRGHEQPVTVYYAPQVPEADAIVAMASQIQDHASEASWGNAFPPCPGHPHPLEAHVVDDVAVWECPRSGEHHREAIFPRPRS